MTRKDLINEVYWKLNPDTPTTAANHLSSVKFTKKDIELILVTGVDYVAKTVAKGGTVNLRGFGSFARRSRVGRVGRNPNTGEPIEIPNKKVIKFRPALAFQKAVNNNR